MKTLFSSSYPYLPEEINHLETSTLKSKGISSWPIWICSQMYIITPLKLKVAIIISAMEYLCYTTQVFGYSEYCGDFFLWAIKSNKKIQSVSRTGWDKLPEWFIWMFIFAVHSLQPWWLKDRNGTTLTKKKLQLSLENISFNNIVQGEAIFRNTKYSLCLSSQDLH